jgi:hypothetical protein
MEELAAMVGGIRSGLSKQPTFDGCLAVGHLELSDPQMPRASPEVVPNIGRWDFRAVLQGTPSNQLLLDGRFCSRIVVAADSLGWHITLLFALFVLFDKIPRRISVAVLPASVFSARDLGSPSGFANFKDEIELGHSTGNNHYCIDASRLERRSAALVGNATVDFELGPDLAGLVSGCDVMDNSGGNATSVKRSADFPVCRI